MSELAQILDPREIARTRLLHPACFRYRHMVRDDSPEYTSVDDVVARALERGNLARIPQERMMKLYEKLRWEPRTSKLALAMDKYLVRRDEQQETLEGLNVHALLELISQGYLPAELSEQLGVSHQVIHAYMLRAAEGDSVVEEALQLCADVQAYRGLQDIQDTDEQSKAGVQKGVELAKHRMAIARALNPKRYSEKPLPVPIGGMPGAPGGGAWLVLDVTSNLEGYQNPDAHVVSTVPAGRTPGSRPGPRQINAPAPDTHPVQATPAKHDDLLYLLED